MEEDPVEHRNRLGVKHTCGTCQRKFYDLNRPNAQCPICGNSGTVDVEVIHTEPISMPPWETIRLQALSAAEDHLALAAENAAMLSRVVNEAIARGRATVQRTTHAWPYGKWLKHRTVEEKAIVEFFWADL